MISAPCLAGLTLALNVLERVASEWGLTINYSKTEVMVMQQPNRQQQQGRPPLVLSARLRMRGRRARWCLAAWTGNRVAGNG